VIKSWGNKIARDIWEKDSSSKLPRNIWVRAKALLTIMHATSTINDLAARGAPPALRPHPLRGDRTGTMAVDIDGKTCPWRITFVFRSGEFFDVAIENYH
jgi:plasmid maintenance system killer protein